MWEGEAAFGVVVEGKLRFRFEHHVVLVALLALVVQLRALALAVRQNADGFGVTASSDGRLISSRQAERVLTADGNTADYIRNLEVVESLRRELFRLVKEFLDAALTLSLSGLTVADAEALENASHFVHVVADRQLLKNDPVAKVFRNERLRLVVQLDGFRLLLAVLITHNSTG